MPTPSVAFAQVANCLDYPRADTSMGARLLAREVRPHHEEMAGALQALADWLDARESGEAQERYTRLFDLSPVCTLNISYHIWGDTYQRGAFLSEMARELREVKLDPGDELPDYLPTILRLLERMNDLDDIQLLVGNVVHPALQRMQERLADSELPWAEVIRTLPSFLASAGWRPRPAPSPLHVVGGGPIQAAGGGCPYA